MINEHYNITCSFTDCIETFLSMIGLTSYLKYLLNINIESTLLNFNAIEGISNL